MKNSSSALISFLVLTLLLISASSAAKPKPKCHPKDQIAIEKITASFGINFTGDCCDWSVVLCSYYPPYNRVIYFALQSSNISGKIPDAIGDLSYLQNLQFFNLPKLTGNIPKVISKLSELSFLYIANTGISGRIPVFPLKKLTFLFFFDNALTGSIPSQLPTLFPNLHTLQLKNNKLTGTIPESFGHFSGNFTTLDLSGNSLTGPIPKSLGNLDQLDGVFLSGNKFTGDASFLFGKNKKAEYLFLDGNNFSFDFSKVGIPTGLRQLNLSHNRIFGSIPQELSHMMFLTNFDVSYNRLCGQIPQGGGLQAFETSAYSHNKCLCDAPLPSCVK